MLSVKAVRGLCGLRPDSNCDPRACAFIFGDLLIERQGHRKHSVRGLDYFYDAAQALTYSIEWGRLWVKSEVRKHPEATHGTVTAEAGGEQR